VLDTGLRLSVGLKRNLLRNLCLLYRVISEPTQRRSVQRKIQRGGERTSISLLQLIKMLKFDALLLFLDVITACKFTGLLRIICTLITVQNCMYVNNIGMQIHSYTYLVICCRQIFDVQHVRAAWRALMTHSDAEIAPWVVLFKIVQWRQGPIRDAFRHFEIVQQILLRIFKFPEVPKWPVAATNKSHKLWTDYTQRQL